MSAGVQSQQQAMSIANAQQRRMSEMSAGVQSQQQAMSIANAHRRSEMRIGGQQQGMSIANPQQQQTPVPVQNVGMQMQMQGQHQPNDRQQSTASESSSHSNLLGNLEARKLRNNQVRVAESYRCGFLFLHGGFSVRGHMSANRNSKSESSTGPANGPAPATSKYPRHGRVPDEDRWHGRPAGAGA